MRARTGTQGHYQTGDGWAGVEARGGTGQRVGGDTGALVRAAKLSSPHQISDDD